MHLTTFSDYTLRVLMYLAIDPAKLATIPAIAAAYAISENHLMKVVQHLARDDAKTLAIFGTGVQGLYHALAIPAVRKIERILVRGSSPEKS